MLISTDFWAIELSEATLAAVLEAYLGSTLALRSYYAKLVEVLLGLAFPNFNKRS